MPNTSLDPTFEAKGDKNMFGALVTIGGAVKPEIQKRIIDGCFCCLGVASKETVS